MKKLRSILLVDDNSQDNEFHEIVIKKSGLADEVISISDTKHALEYMKNCLDSDCFPDLIFLDILMPRKDGFELLNEFKSVLATRQQVNAKKPVIIMLSGSYNPLIEIYLNSPNYDDLVAGYRLKPLTKNMLTEIVENYF